jgi:hypothetical protein
MGNGDVREILIFGTKTRDRLGWKTILLRPGELRRTGPSWLWQAFVFVKNYAVTRRRGTAACSPRFYVKAV